MYARGGYAPNVVSIKMLRKYETQALPDVTSDITPEIRTLRPWTNSWPRTCFDTSNTLR